MARVLVLVGDPARRPNLDQSLAAEGHERVWCSSIDAAVNAARAARPDIVLLDWTLPDGTASDALTALREGAGRREIPFAFLTPRGEEADRIRGFELGASDYIVEPASTREVALRVRAVVRRSEVAASGRTLQNGCLRLDPAAHRAWVDDREIDLTLLERKLLLALVENKERVQTRADLLERAWGGDVSITTRTVDTHIKRLRDKLGPAGDYVQTVRGIGYRFAVPPR
jgi:two-component system phosphate regulon response regulator PhoB